MNLLELISQRKSVRNYLDKQISDEDLKTILEAGRLAPSWMNVQSWKFILVKSQENKDLLSQLSIGQLQVKNADALIVCVADMGVWETSGISNIQNSALNPALQAENGILIKSAESLEMLHNIDTVVLDKTGTITEGKPKVVEIISLKNNEKELLKYAASIEKKSEHPLATAIVQKSIEENLDLIEVED